MSLEELIAEMGAWDEHEEWLQELKARQERAIEVLETAAIIKVIRLDRLTIRLIFDKACSVDVSLDTYRDLE